MTAKKKASAEHTHTEYRFVPDQTDMPNTSAMVGLGGAFALGFGVYARWISAAGPSYAPVLIAAGAALLGGAFWYSDSNVVPVRIGDTGIALEKNDEITRLPWCDIERAQIEGNALGIQSRSLTLQLPLTAHREAVAWFLSELARRIPQSLDVKPSATAQLPDPKQVHGEVVPVEGFQVAGRVCASSKKNITFERDARLCRNCGQIYHRSHVPPKCLTCEHELAGHTVAV